MRGKKARAINRALGGYRGRAARAGRQKRGRFPAAGISGLGPAAPPSKGGAAPRYQAGPPSGRCSTQQPKVISATLGTPTGRAKGAGVPHGVTHRMA